MTDADCNHAEFTSRHQNVVELALGEAAGRTLKVEVRGGPCL